MTKERIAEIIREETYVATNAGGDQYIVEGYIEAAARIAAGLPTEPAQPKPPSDADIAAMQADGKPGDSRCGNDPPADTTRESAVLAGLRGQVAALKSFVDTAVVNGAAARALSNSRLDAIEAYLQRPAPTKRPTPRKKKQEVVLDYEQQPVRTSRPATGKATPPPRGARKGRR